MAANNVILNEAERMMVRRWSHSANPVVEKALQSEHETLNVTLFVGNGFDLGLGLKTGYQDFLRHYLNRKLKINEVVDSFVGRIQRDKDLWGDAELAFGQLDFSSLGRDVESVYRMCIHDFQQSLESYLSDEASRLIINKGQLVATRELLSLAIINMIKGVNLSAIFDGVKKIVINVLTLNYTDTIDRLLDYGGKTLRSQISFRHQGTNVGIEIKDVVHLHGQIGMDSWILFGVDNPSQVADLKLRALCEEAGYLLKPQKAKIASLEPYRKGKDILEKSDIVILFGTSYGKTDMTWWDMIVGNAISDVQGDRKRVNDYCVLLCPYSRNPIDVRGIDDKIYFERQETSKLLGATSPSLSSRLNSNELASKTAERFHVLGYGPFKDPWSGESYFCDPLHLHSIGRQFVNGYDMKPVLDLQYP